MATIDYGNPQTNTVQPRVEQALAELAGAGYGTFSVRAKDKTLIKFGRATLAQDSEQTISTLGTETFQTDNTITHVVTTDSGGASAVDVTVEGHTVTGTGTAAEFTFVVQTVTLNGQTPVELATPLARCSRLYNDGATALTGRVFAMRGTSVSSGVPNPITLAHCEIPAGKQQSAKCATTISNRDALIITGLRVGVLRQASAFVDFELEIREAGKVFRERYLLDASRESGLVKVELDPCIWVPPNADVRIVGTSSANSTGTVGTFSGYLALRAA